MIRPSLLLPLILLALLPSQCRRGHEVNKSFQPRYAPQTETAAPTAPIAIPPSDDNLPPDTVIFDDEEAYAPLDEPETEVAPAPLRAAPIEDEVVMERMGYTVSYNPATRCPHYVAWTLTAVRTEGSAKRSPKFYEDPDLPPSQRALLSDYYNSGFDRGHLCPAGDNKWDAQAMNESFYLSNMCPQTHTLNSGDWRILEESCRTWARKRCERLYIVAGPLYDEHPRRLKRHVAVPKAFFKALLCLDKDNEKGIAFLFDNGTASLPLEKRVITIDSLESLTGLNLFHEVPAPLQDSIEAAARWADWR